MKKGRDTVQYGLHPKASVISAESAGLSESAISSSLPSVGVWMAFDQRQWKIGGMGNGQVCKNF